MAVLITSITCEMKTVFGIQERFIYVLLVSTECKIDFTLRRIF